MMFGTGQTPPVVKKQFSKVQGTKHLNENVKRLLVKALKVKSEPRPNHDDSVLKPKGQVALPISLKFQTG